MTRPVLILRPEPGASASAARARSLGLDPIVRPLFRTVAIPWRPPDAAGFDAVLMTSANAARLAGPALAAFAGLPLYAVGARTADAARAIGFADILTGSADAQAVVGEMARDGVGSAFHPAGADRIAIDDAGVTITSVTVYAAELVDPPPALDRRAVAMLHSPRAARRFAALTPEREDVAIAAISAATCAAAGGGWGAVAVAARPCDEALLAAAVRLCQL